VARFAVLLRGVNVGGHHRVPMAELRSALAGAGFTEAATHLQSGNVVLSGDGPAEAVARRCQALIAEHFGFEIPCAVRTREEMEAVVRADPLADLVTDPRLYQVSFLSAAPAPEVLPRLAAAATPDERFAVIGREIYAWHPDGIARSRLATLLAGRALDGTARNWTTVTTLLAMMGG
jgi:uncharacterized protein (DUF1697 family)